MSGDSGTIAFLMTDIEGSTRLWEEEPDAMSEALATHDTLLRSAVEGIGGRVVKTTGDGLLATFPSISAGLQATAAAQRSITERPWPTSRPLRVRMAVHVGEARIRDEDVFGPAINRVARLLGIGHGGQVLLSGAAAGVAGGATADGLSLRDLGEHRLKDLTGVEHVFQLEIDGLIVDFPPLRSLRSERTNLPNQLTSFIGREQEIADVRERLRTAQLVTLIGTGGTGKTRLALQVAAESVDRYRDGAWLVELAPVAEGHVIVPAIAAALDVRERPGQTLEATLIDFLRDKSLLLVIDNCEHLIGDVSTIAHRLLRECRELAILATSREALGIPGESVYQTPSLAVPPDLAVPAGGGSAATPLVDLAAISGAAAVRLFVERASTAVPSFGIDEQNAAAVAQICRRLDGIPLAIELAAARVALLSAPEIATRLADRFRLLTGGSRTALPRQQTLQALVDWSWELLDEDERCLFRRLSVFAGGWTLEAAEAVVAEDAPGGGALDVLSLLDHLVRKSLVVVDRTSVGTRYRFLETIRQYARDRLIAAGEAEQVRVRHHAWCLELMRLADLEVRDARMVETLLRIDPERDNLRSAFEWALEADPEGAADLAATSAGYLRMRSISSEGLEASLAAAAAVRALPPGDAATMAARDRLVVRALAGAVYAAIGGGSAWRTPSIIAEMQQLSAGMPDPEIRLIVLLSACLAAFWTGNRDLGMPAAIELIELATARREPWHLSMAYATRATLEAFDDDLHAAEATSRLAIEAANRSGNPFMISNASIVRGRIAGKLGWLDEARRVFDVALDKLATFGDVGFVNLARSDLAHALRRSGELDEAEALYRETLPIWRRSGNRGAVAHQLESVGYVLAGRGTRDEGLRAARLLAAATAYRAISEAGRLPDEQEDYDRTIDALREAIGTDAVDAALAEGSRLSVDEAAEVALGG